MWLSGGWPLLVSKASRLPLTGGRWEPGVGKELGAHAEAATVSDLDGIHTLTCALMLLNTDLHGHVSWGGRERVCPLTDSSRVVQGPVLSPAPFPRPPARWPVFL